MMPTATIPLDGTSGRADRLDGFTGDGANVDGVVASSELDGRLPDPE
jgi:hypothetical protein